MKAQMSAMGNICLVMLRGSDLSPLFTDVVNLLATPNYKLKKLVYSFLLQTICLPQC